MIFIVSCHGDSVILALRIWNIAVQLAAAVEMSSHFSANQYEAAFVSQRLQNYQVPAKHKEHPSLRKGATKIIVNDRGHLNPDMNCSTRSPWGSFVGTWQMERKPIQLKTRTKLSAHLYGYSAPVGSRGSSHGGSARSPSVAGSKDPTSQIPQPLAVQSPQNGSRPNTSDSNSSWVIIESAPSHPSSAAADSCPPSQPNSHGGGAAIQSPLPEGSRAQSAVVASRSPTPPGVRQSPSIRSPSIVSAGDDVSLPPTRSNTAVSQQTNSRPQSRMGGGSQAPSPLASRPASSVVGPQNNKLQTPEAITSPSLIKQNE